MTIFFITIENNGKGFEHDASAPSKSMGILNLKNRVDYLQEKMEINSDSEGTTINIELNTYETDIINIVIVDNHPIVIEGLKMMLKNESFFSISKSFTSGNEAVELLKTTNEVDIMLLVFP